MTNKEKPISEVYTPPIIWHYDIPLNEVIDLVLPQNSTIFDLMLFENLIGLFVLCDEDAPPQKRQILLLSKENYLEYPDVQYLGTVSLIDGNIIFHVFENLEVIEKNEVEGE